MFCIFFRPLHLQLFFRRHEQWPQILMLFISEECSVYLLSSLHFPLCLSSRQTVPFALILVVLVRRHGFERLRSAGFTSCFRFLTTYY
jgi:hypothetical protein